MIKFFKEMLSDDQGYASAMRWVFVWFGTAFALVVCLAYGYACWCAKAMVDIPGGVTEILGVLLAGKTAQRAVEAYAQKKGEPPAPAS